MTSSPLRQRQAAGLVLLALIAALFLAFSQWPALDSVRLELAAVGAAEEECVQGICTEIPSETSFFADWLDIGLIFLRLVGAGVIVATGAFALSRALLFPEARRRRGFLAELTSPWMAGTVGPGGYGVNGVLASLRTSIGANLPAVLVVALVVTPVLGGNNIALAVVGVALAVALVANLAAQQATSDASGESRGSDVRRRSVLAAGLWAWARALMAVASLVLPFLLLTAVVAGAVVQWQGTDAVADVLGNDTRGIAIAASIGLVLNPPFLLAVPVVALLLLLGAGTVPAAVLLFLAAVGGPVGLWGLSRRVTRRGLAGAAVAAWAIAFVGGLAVWAVGPREGPAEAATVAAAARSVEAADVIAEGPRISEQDLPTGIRERETTDAERPAPSPDSLVLRGEPARFAPFSGDGTRPDDDSVTPFVNVAQTALNGSMMVWNDRPGVAIFDYDRDGDPDFYITTMGGFPNRLYRNLGDGTFEDVGEAAGVAAVDSHSTGAVACDLNNDGYQDLYVGAWGDPKDKLDFRSPSDGQGNKDGLYLNNGDGTFTEITDAAFGKGVNYRSATSIACADVDGDSWLDLYVGNLGAHDFRDFASANHPGHYNVLYRNNGDLTFTDVAGSAGVRRTQIVMRDTDGKPILFEDPLTGEKYEGWDPTYTDAQGNQIGEPTGQTHAVMFFDYDDDGDPDLWVGNDGDRLRVYRNDSSSGRIRFTPVSEAMGVDTVGAWMGFAVGDYDGDADLDVFVANIGYHPLLRKPMRGPSGSCEYHMRFSWGTCSHFLLNNRGVRDVPGLGTVGNFKNVAPATDVAPSPLMPPASLDATNIHPLHEVPAGLAAYDFGFGTSFFDFDNDGDQDLYWLGSNVASGFGPGGQAFPAAGRMLRGDGRGGFEDITARAHLLDILGVDYSDFNPSDPSFNARARKMDTEFHENGKGLAHGDLNGDGYVDLIGTNSSGRVWEGRADTVMEIFAPLFLWLNGGGDNSWITLRLKGRMAIDGTGSNADGIGARVYVKTAGSQGETLVQVQEVRAGSSYLSMDSLELEFGLGSATLVDGIVIFWPSGRQQEMSDVAVNQIMEIVEPTR